MMVGLGNALVDYALPLKADNPFLAQIQENKGGFFHTSQDDFLNMLALTEGTKFSCGGSTANALKAYAHCGGECAFIGKVGDDARGEAFALSLSERGVRPCLAQNPDLPTGCSVVWVDENGEKTIAAKRLAGGHIQNADIDWVQVISAGWLLAEGYWLDGNNALLRRIVQLAYVAGVKIALSLSDEKIVSERTKTLAMILPYVSILFGNEAEFKALGGFVRHRKMLQLKTRGANGVDVYLNGRIVHYDAPSVQNVVSTTGAGDAFAGGFLFGYLRTFNISKSVALGQNCAASVLQSSKSHL